VSTNSCESSIVNLRDDNLVVYLFIFNLFCLGFSKFFNFFIHSVSRYHFYVIALLLISFYFYFAFIQLMNQI